MTDHAVYRAAVFVATICPSSRLYATGSSVSLANIRRAFSLVLCRGRLPGASTIHP
jgi:hypothetical protein